MTRQAIFACCLASLVALGLGNLSACAQSSTPAQEGLVADADLVAAVQIVSTDYTATAADGPMYAEARLLKVIKGGARQQATIRFGASAWVGPSYQEGELRIIFLERLSEGHNYYQKARWASLEAGHLDVFIAEDAAESCSKESLLAFLKSVRTRTEGSLRLASTVLRGASGTPMLSIKIVNDGASPIWLSPARLRSNVEAGGVRYPLRVEWDHSGRDGQWISIESGAALAGRASLRAHDIEGAPQITLLLSHRSVLFPYRPWVGSFSTPLGLRSDL